MIKEKIAETVGKRSNRDLSMWYQGKVFELAGFFVKKLKEENMPIENIESFEYKEAEVIAK